MNRTAEVDVVNTLVRREPACVLAVFVVLCLVHAASASDTIIPTKPDHTENLARQLCDSDADRDERMRSLSQILKLPRRDRMYALQYAVKNCDVDYAYTSALVLLQMDGKAAVELLQPRVVNWPSIYQKGILENKTLQQDPTLALHIASAIIDTSVNSNGWPKEEQYQSEVLELAAVYLAASQQQAHRVLAHEVLGHHPELDRVWLILLLEDDITEEEMAVARRIFADKAISQLHRVVVGIVLADHDVDARAFCERQIVEFLTEYGARSVDETVRNFQSEENWRDQYSAYQKKLELASILRFAPEELASGITFRFIRSQNAKIRSILGLVAATRWPERLRKDYADAFSVRDFQQLEAKIALRRARETKVNESGSDAAGLKRLQSYTGFGHIVDSVAWWAH